MTLLEQMENVNPSERIILTYDAWCMLMNDVAKLDRVARALTAEDADEIIQYSIPLRIVLKLNEFMDALKEVEDLL